MNTAIDLDKARYRASLNCWLQECRRRMSERFPLIDFDSDSWPVQSLYQTTQSNWTFNASVNDFSDKDQSFCDIVRCLVAEMIIRPGRKDLSPTITSFRFLAAASATSPFDLTLSDLKMLEERSLVYCRQHRQAAQRHRVRLIELAKQLLLLASRNVIPHLGYRLHASVRSELLNLERCHKSEKKVSKKGSDLDRKMEAFNDAVNAMVDLDPRIDAMDKAALCAVLRKLCAPSRINEVLCSSIDDYVTVENYAHLPTGVLSVGHRVHQLLITMKGSKGAQWSAKPALTFMIDAFHYSEETIKKFGTRSRMLVEWYETNPTRVYLPPELEYLRGQMLSRNDLAKIIYLTNTPTSYSGNTILNIFNRSDNRFKSPNPDGFNAIGRRNSQKLIDFIPWVDAERILLEQVHRAMMNCRKVTQSNYYEGRLSRMLFLFDRDELPYLPFALTAQHIRRRLKRRDATAPPTLFEKLGITIPINGRIQWAEMDTHDARRWLTTMALREGEKLSDVLINKWANRSSLTQLRAYDFRTAEELASFSKMPAVPELSDLSEGLKLARKLENPYGVKSEVVVVHNAEISLTSLDRILEAAEDRPVAKTSEQIIVLYPTPYGACLHQHHETPCQRYAPCLTCDNNCSVKGHLLTNNAIRKEATLVATTIVRQLEKLVLALNRGLADCPDMFAEHLAMLVRRGLCPTEMADHLIEEFHEIKDQIQDKLLRKRLEEAFVARGYVSVLNDDSVPDGALIKYTNPRQHASPGIEIALDSHGGREKVAKDEQILISRFPVFANKALGILDQRHMIEADEDEGGE